MHRRGFLASLAALVVAPVVPTPVPAFSAGGIGRRPTVALIGEHGPENVVIHIDGRQIGRIVGAQLAESMRGYRTVGMA